MPTENPKLLAQTRVNFCLACGRANYIDAAGLPHVEAHHVQEKQMGNAFGGDDWWNQIPLCTNCHTAEEWSWHRNLKLFFEKFPHVLSYLKLFGWEVLDVGYKIKLIHPAYVNCKPKQKPEWAIPWDTLRKYLKPKKGGEVV